MVSSNLQLWYAKAGEHTLETELAVIPLLGATETQRLNRIGSDKKKREFLLSRALMRHALSELFNTPAEGWHFTEKVNCAPLINNLPKKIFTSLSHSHGHIFFALSIFPVGVDVELVRDKKQLLEKASLFMSKQELESFKSIEGANQLDNFYNIWCAKESYFKANKRKQKSMKFTALSIADDIASSKHWSLIADRTNEVHYAVVVRNQAKAVNVSRHRLVCSMAD